MSGEKPASGLREAAIPVAGGITEGSDPKEGAASRVGGLKPYDGPMGQNPPGPVQPAPGPVTGPWQHDDQVRAWLTDPRLHLFVLLGAGAEASLAEYLRRSQACERYLTNVASMPNAKLSPQEVHRVKADARYRAMSPPWDEARWAAEGARFPFGRKEWIDGFLPAAKFFAKDERISPEEETELAHLGRDCGLDAAAVRRWMDHQYPGLIWESERPPEPVVPQAIQNPLVKIPVLGVIQSVDHLHQLATQSERNWKQTAAVLPAVGDAMAVSTHPDADRLAAAIQTALQKHPKPEAGADNAASERLEWALWELGYGALRLPDPWSPAKVETRADLVTYADATVERVSKAALSGRLGRWLSRAKPPVPFQLRPDARSDPGLLEAAIWRLLWSLGEAGFRVGLSAPITTLPALRDSIRQHAASGSLLEAMRTGALRDWLTHLQSLGLAQERDVKAVDAASGVEESVRLRALNWALGDRTLAEGTQSLIQTLEQVAELVDRDPDNGIALVNGPAFAAWSRIVLGKTVQLGGGTPRHRLHLRLWDAGLRDLFVGDLRMATPTALVRVVEAYKGVDLWTALRESDQEGTLGAWAALHSVPERERPHPAQGTALSLAKHLWAMGSKALWIPGFGGLALDALRARLASDDAARLWPALEALEAEGVLGAWAVQVGEVGVTSQANERAGKDAGDPQRARARMYELGVTRFWHPTSGALDDEAGLLAWSDARRDDLLKLCAERWIQAWLPARAAAIDAILADEGPLPKAERLLRLFGAARAKWSIEGSPISLGPIGPGTSHTSMIWIRHQGGSQSIYVKVPPWNPSDLLAVELFAAAGTLFVADGKAVSADTYEILPGRVMQIDVTVTVKPGVRGLLDGKIPLRIDDEPVDVELSGSVELSYALVGAWAAGGAAVGALALGTLRGIAESGAQGAYLDSSGQYLAASDVDIARAINLGHMATWSVAIAGAALLVVIAVARARS